MTFNTILQSFIDAATTQRDNLLNFINQAGAETIITGNANTPAPEVDENDVWTLTQDTADSGIYAGSYKLALKTGCVFVQSVTVVSHTTPVDNIAARYQACGSSTWITLPDVEDLDGLELQAFEIRSSIAFEVQIHIALNLVEPVIDTAGSCAGNGYGGTNIVDDSDGYWVIRSTVASTSIIDDRIIIKDAFGRNFTISNITYPDGGAASCHAWRTGTNLCQSDSCTGTPYTGTVNQYGWTFPMSSSRRVRFLMSPA